MFVYSQACRVAPGACDNPPGRPVLHLVDRAFVQGVSMASDSPSWVRFFPRDFLHGTEQMTAEARGVYITLLCWQADAGALPGDMPGLAKLCHMNRRSFARIWPQLAGKFTDISGKFINERMASERENSLSYQQVQRKKAQKRWHAGAYAQAMPSTTTSTLRSRSSGPSSVDPDHSKDLSENGHGVWRAPSEKRPATILHGPELRRHGQHAYCGQFVPCVPLTLDLEFAKVGKKSPTEMTLWYREIDRSYEAQPVGDDAFAFWRNLFAAWVGTVTARPRDTKHSRLSAILKGTT